MVAGASTNPTLPAKVWMAKARPSQPRSTDAVRFSVADAGQRYQPEHQPIGWREAQRDHGAAHDGEPQQPEPPRAEAIGQEAGQDPGGTARDLNTAPSRPSAA
jgi:hypothetical protein